MEITFTWEKYPHHERGIHLDLDKFFFIGRIRIWFECIISKSVEKKSRIDSTRLSSRSFGCWYFWGNSNHRHHLLLILLTRSHQSPYQTQYISYSLNSNSIVLHFKCKKEKTRNTNKSIISINLIRPISACIAFQQNRCFPVVAIVIVLTPHLCTDWSVREKQNYVLCNARECCFFQAITQFSQQWYISHFSL